MKNKMCAKCMHFYCCNLTQITTQCPILTKQSLPFVGDDDHAPDNVDRGGNIFPNPKPLTRPDDSHIPWDAKEGCDCGGGT